ncbi:MAG TPA: hypothetical protein ENN05_13340 [Deltaproteobacteria bacterium]|nr:hypothetical protein [Deltaproteobacteria bacterium]
MGKDSVDKTQQEIIEEMAKALGNTGDKLESVLNRLKKIERELESINDINEYNAMIDSFNTLRKQAISRREMLMIHREALGAFKHTYVERYYPIPNKKDKR